MQQILMVGGIGRMEEMYRAAAQSLGFDLVYCEAKIKGKTPPEVAAILVVTSVVSHPLREHAARLARDLRIPIFYSRQPSMSMVRGGFEKLKEDLQRVQN